MLPPSPITRVNITKHGAQRGQIWFALLRHQARIRYFTIYNVTRPCSISNQDLSRLQANFIWMDGSNPILQSKMWRGHAVSVTKIYPDFRPISFGWTVPLPRGEFLCWSIPGIRLWRSWLLKYSMNVVVEALATEVFQECGSGVLATIPG